MSVGMGDSARITIAVQTEPFSIPVETALLIEGLSDVGAIATLVGLCCSEGERLAAIELEHYPGLAETELRDIVRQASARWPLSAVTLIHRIGRIAIGEPIVVVLAASAHRAITFEAADFIMDYIETRASFRKKDLPAEEARGAWVEARDSDAEAFLRWRRSNVHVER